MKKIGIITAILMFFAIMGTANAAVDVNVAMDSNYVNGPVWIISFFLGDSNHSAITDMNVNIAYGTTSSGEYAIGDYGGTTIAADFNARDLNCASTPDYVTGFRTPIRCTYTWTVTGLTSDTNYTFDINAVAHDVNLQQTVAPAVTLDANADSNTQYYDIQEPQNPIWTESIDGTVTIVCSDNPATPQTKIYYKKDDASSWTTATATGDSISTTITLDTDSIDHVYRYYCFDKAENSSSEKQQAVAYPVTGRRPVIGPGVPIAITAWLQGASAIGQAQVPNALIVIGVGLIVIYLVFGGKKKRKSKRR